MPDRAYLIPMCLAALALTPATITVAILIFRRPDHARAEPRKVQRGFPIEPTHRPRTGDH